MRYLEKVRIPEKQSSQIREVLFTTAALMLGICLGIFSKFLDFRQTELPDVLRLIDRTLDVHNFLGTFAPWIVLAVFISIKSRSPIRAGINVFAFFAGMVTSYYLYSNFVAGFFPKSYDMGRIYFDFSHFSIFLLVCKRERLGCACYLCWHFGIHYQQYAAVWNVVCKYPNMVAFANFNSWNNYFAQVYQRDNLYVRDCNPDCCFSRYGYSL